MKKTLLSPLTLKSTLTLLVLAFVFVFSLTYIIEDLRFYTLKESVLGRFFAIKWWLIGHLSGGILALLIGPFQFWANFRNKYLKLHRNLGKVYLISILIASLCSTYMAWNTAIMVHWAWAFSLQGLAFVWLISSFMAYRSIRRKQIENHKEWMVRSYVVTTGFVSFRWIMALPFIQNLGSFPEVAPTVVWSILALSLFITEVILRWNK